MLRRLHRTEVDAARHQVDWLPKAIERDRARLRTTEGRLAWATQRLAAVEQDAREAPALVAELAGVRGQLDADGRERGLVAARGLLPVASRELGERPAPGGAAEELWRDAAGRLLQHHVAFGEPCGSLLGRELRPVGDDAYASSRQAAVEALGRLDRSLGREPEIEPPNRSLGLSL